MVFFFGLNHGLNGFRDSTDYWDIEFFTISNNVTA